MSLRPPHQAQAQSPWWMCTVWMEFWCLVCSLCAPVSTSRKYPLLKSGWYLKRSEFGICFTKLLWLESRKHAAVAIGLCCNGLLCPAHKMNFKISIYQSPTKRTRVKNQLAPGTQPRRVEILEVPRMTPAPNICGEKLLLVTILFMPQGIPIPLVMCKLVLDGSIKCSNKLGPERSCKG